MTPRPHVRGALPFLRSGPVWRVHASARAELTSFLGSAGYEVVTLDGRRMGSRDAAHTELGRAFGFPDWYGHNWDAWYDSIIGVMRSYDGRLLAVVLDHLEEAAAAAPVTTGEVLWALLALRDEYAYPPASGPPRATVTLDVFALGTGPDFDRP